MFRGTFCCGLALAIFLCGCPGAEPTGLSLKVVPEEIDDTIPEQMCVLLVTKGDDDPIQATVPLTITATAEGASVIVEHGTIVEDQVAEVIVTMRSPEAEAVEPGDGPGGWPCSATIHAAGGGLAREIEVPITLTSQEEDLLGPAAVEMRDRFIPWLAENHPELGIDETTEWVGTIVKPHWLVVSHYLFFSNGWEMHVSWHVMIAPYDWARIELRRRFEETLPSLAFEIPSVSAAGPVTINEIQPEGVLWR